MGRAPTKTNDGAKVERGVEQIIARAAKNDVSDVHIEPGQRFVLVRYRRAGQLYVANKLPKGTASEIARHIKQLAGLDTEQTSAPQSGQYELKAGDNKFVLQVDTLPVLDGEKITIKIVRDSVKAPSLEALGLWGETLKMVEHALAQPHGLILAVGSQAKPRAATISAMLQTLITPKTRVGFIDNDASDLPLNIRQIAVRSGATLPAVRQLQLLTKDGLDAVGISSIKDKKTAKEAVETALSKRLIVTGIAADYAMQGLKSLQQMEGSHSASLAISLVVGQAFARRLCENCREAYEPTLVQREQLATIFHIDRPAAMKRLHELEKLAAQAGLSPDQPLSTSEKTIHLLWRANPDGCEVCDYTGFSAGIGIFEVCAPDDQLRGQMANNKSIQELEASAVRSGMNSLPVDALVKALRGLIDFPTLLNVYATTA